MVIKYNGKRYTYELTTNIVDICEYKGIETFGIAIYKSKTFNCNDIGECYKINNIFSSYTDANSFLQLISRNDVSPIHITDVVYDIIQ